jgi:hypothetical protein
MDTWKYAVRKILTVSEKEFKVIKKNKEAHISSKGALLVNVSTSDGRRWGLKAKTNVANVTSQLEITALGHNLGGTTFGSLGSLDARTLLAQGSKRLLAVLEDGGLLEVSTLILKVGHW